MRSRPGKLFSMVQGQDRIVPRVDARFNRSRTAKAHVRFAALAVIGLATCSAPPPRQATVEAAHHVRGPWPPDSLVFPLHPGMQFESYANGLRLAWLDHPLPPGRCSLRLVVHVGSLDELDGERGMAHFVEHMAFNGTERFPGTSIFPWFNSQGMASGRDVNAFTSYTSTIFNIDLESHTSPARSCQNPTAGPGFRSWVTSSN